MEVGNKKIWKIEVKMTMRKLPWQNGDHIKELQKAYQRPFDISDNFFLDFF